jgi:3',5'-cyclic AMP phosphodiesterase CpdA
MLIAQISDLHITMSETMPGGVVDTSAMLERAVATLIGLRPPPEVVLISGDLVERGTAEEYAKLRRLLSPLPMPCFVIPGNHDHHEHLRAAFKDDGYLPASGPLNYVIDRYPVRIIALDSVVERAAHGALSESTLAWLAARLKDAAGQATLVMLHHPPFATGIRFMDDIMLLEGRDALEQLIARYPNVQAVVCGHVHRAVEARFGGTLAAIAPSTCHQIPLDLSGAQAETYVMEPPGIRLMVWDGARLSLHVQPVGHFPGPYPFV